MPYKYRKIYNATTAEWAIDVSGDEDATTIWENNEWNECDALVGFYSDDNGDHYDVIYCRPGFAIYVQSENAKARDTYRMHCDKYRIPPAILVDLNEESDRKFLHLKNYPYDEDEDDNATEVTDTTDSSDSSDDDDVEEDEEEEEEEEEEQEDAGTEIEDDSHEDEYLTTHIALNQRVIDFLYRCQANTNNPYKKEAYSRAINEIYSYWSSIEIDEWEPFNIGASIANRIRKFLHLELPKYMNEMIKNN
jgi:hypothetical protein